MELKDFITKTIVEISDGINEAHTEMQKKVIGYMGEQSVEIKFDISVSFDDSSTVSGGGKLNVVGLITGHADKNVKTTHNNNNRIEFKITSYVFTGHKK